ncbi:MAG: aminotransferase class III-fold pyridoxal phosphate-dependent enzyme [Nevskiaceae bacterium]
MSKSQDLVARARRRIPGGTQLLSKRPELFLPDQWPAYYRSARGVEVEDADGRRYVDVTHHSVGACPLGYADPDVDRAVIAAIEAGSTSTLLAPEEVELAELLCELHPWAEMTRYTRGGGEAMAVAVRIARAATGRERVAFSGYHGWHDWYLAANLGDRAALDGHLLPAIEPAGVPPSLVGTVVAFPWGDAAALDAVAGRHGRDLAAIVLEPARYALPPPGYLAHVRAVAARLGAVLVLDEVTSGFRLNVGGYHLLEGVVPDLAVFAKGIANGFPMGAVIGTRPVMEAALGCFISSTSWSERTGPVAALATIRKLQARRVPQHLAAMGLRMRAGWEAAAARHSLPVVTRGIAPLPSFAFEHAEARALATLYTQCMLDQGFLASGAFYASLAHAPEVVDAALAATNESFAELRRALDAGRVRKALRGRVAETGLRKNPPPTP